MEDLGRMHAFYELRKQQFLDGPLTRMGEITYSNCELDDVAKNILPINRLDVAKGGESHPNKVSIDSSLNNTVFRNACC